MSLESPDLSLCSPESHSAEQCGLMVHLLHLHGQCNLFLSPGWIQWVAHEWNFSRALEK